jgi:hypothetical protein
MRGKIAISNHTFLFPEDTQDRVFAPERGDQRAKSLRKCRDFFLERGVEVHTIDTVDFNDPALDYVIYFDFFWHYYRTEPYLRRIPKEKRVLVMFEPPNVNPALYYMPWFRRQFRYVFTYSARLLRQPHHYFVNNPMTGAGDQIPRYLQDANMEIPFEKKKRLVTISQNRWSYMPTSNFEARNRVFAYFDREWPDDFDLYGGWWNRPRVFYERWFGYRTFRTWRGPVPYTADEVGERIRILRQYKFYLCFENTASEPGFVTDHTTDAFCARCVPVYHGSTEIGRYIPSECLINYRDFRNASDLARYLLSIDKGRYAQYIRAIEAFLRSDKARFFTMDFMFQAIFDRLYGDANRS